MMTLENTIDMMMDKDYKERFRAEYFQLKIRYEKLKAMCEKWDRNELDFVPTCPRDLYNVQLDSMSTYLSVLKLRARKEDVDLEEPQFDIK